MEAPPYEMETAPAEVKETWKQSYPNLISTEPVMLTSGEIENQAIMEWLKTSIDRDVASRGVVDGL